MSQNGCHMKISYLRIKATEFFCKSNFAFSRILRDMQSETNFRLQGTFRTSFSPSA